MSDYLNEAFEYLNKLQEETVPLDAKGIEDLAKFDDDAPEETISVIDTEMTDEEQPTQDYTGKVILDCDVCHSLMYANPEEVEVDETGIANAGKECPNCLAVDGFHVVGQVEPYCADCEKEATEAEATDDDKDEGLGLAGTLIGAGLGGLKGATIGLGAGLAGNVIGKGLASLAKNEDLSYGELSYIENLWDDYSSTLDDVATVDEIEEFVETEFSDYTDEDKKEIASQIEIIEQGKLDNESCKKRTSRKLREEPEWYREPVYDARKSFYGKTKVWESDDGKCEILYSYDTPVACRYNRDFYIVAPNGVTYSQTTTRHLRDWLLDNGQQAGTKAEILRDYKKIPYELIWDLRNWYKGGYLGDKQLDKKFVDFFGGRPNTYKNEALSDIDKYQKWIDYDMKHYGRISKRTNDFVKRAGLQIIKDQYGDYEITAGKYDEAKRREMRYEDFTRAEVETDNSTVEMTADDDGKVTVTTRAKDNKAEPVIGELSDEVKEKILDNNEDTDIEVDFDEVEEESFNRLAENYFTKVYNNVKSFKTKSIRESKNRLVVEGMLVDNKGRLKPTRFVFEAKRITKNGKVKFLGENKTVSKTGKPFILSGDIKNNTLKCESLRYNHRAMVEGKSTRKAGTVYCE